MNKHFNNLELIFIIFTKIRGPVKEIGADECYINFIAQYEHAVRVGLELTVGKLKEVGLHPVLCWLKGRKFVVGTKGSKGPYSIERC
jgi:hypothetical protein